MIKANLVGNGQKRWNWIAVVNAFPAKIYKDVMVLKCPLHPQIPVGFYISPIFVFKVLIPVFWLIESTVGQPNFLKTKKMASFWHLWSQRKACDDVSYRPISIAKLSLTESLIIRTFDSVIMCVVISGCYGGRERDG